MPSPTPSSPWFSLLRAVRAAVAWFSRTRFFRKVGPIVMPPLERATAFVTRGRVQLSGLLVPSLVLHTIGAKSGIERETPLMYCPEPGGRMLVTGSNFARNVHPAWTTNLMANPDAVAVVRGKPITVHAELIGDDERESVWDYIQRQWPGYRGYERASGRVLRIFRLTPRT
ncbi:nitroreductase/quinone reductase family protein [Rathayibacter sp. KR2-224]|uniref:nitroreductase family deazaflavin-dependent oxidoreductase n=1 Tax=Rathayibacter sp. KR2-224 TaxID=3400913 RepID=UPI003C07E5F6